MDQARPDEQLSKLMLQLEELESRFGEFDQFIEQLATKSEDVYEAFSSKKQSLVLRRVSPCLNDGGKACAARDRA